MLNLWLLVERYSWFKMIRKIVEPFISHGRGAKKANELRSQQERWRDGNGGREKLVYTLMLIWCNLQKTLPTEARKGEEMMQNHNEIKLYESFIETSQEKSVALHIKRFTRN